MTIKQYKMKDMFLQEITGSATCGYLEFERAYRGRIKCIDDAIWERNFRLNISLAFGLDRQ